MGRILRRSCAVIAALVACVSTNIDYRLDTSAARTFLSNYVTLP